MKNEEKYKAKAKTDQDLDIDVYSLIATGLKVGLRLNDFYELDFVTLINILDSFYESNNHRKPKYREATQQDIDMIT